MAITPPSFLYIDDAITAFLDLKNTPDPSSDSSQFSDSLQSDSKVSTGVTYTFRMLHSPSDYVDN